MDRCLREVGRSSTSHRKENPVARTRRKEVDLYCMTLRGMEDAGDFYMYYRDSGVSSASR